PRTPRRERPGVASQPRLFDGARRPALRIVSDLLNEKQVNLRGHAVSKYGPQYRSSPPGDGLGLGPREYGTAAFTRLRDHWRYQGGYDLVVVQSRRTSRGFSADTGNPLLQQVLRQGRGLVPGALRSGGGCAADRREV